MDLVLKLKAAAADWQPSKNPYFQHLENKVNGKRKGNLIYLAEDDELLATDLVTQLEHDDFIVKYFSDLESFVAAFHQEIPSAIIMDIMFKEGGI